VRAAAGDSVAQRDYYLALALGLLARADGEPDPEKRAGFEALAASYRRMAEQAPHEGDPIIDAELPIEETKHLRNSTHFRPNSCPLKTQSGHVRRNSTRYFR
jgi:hypothetical protein